MTVPIVPQELNTFRLILKQLDSGSNTVYQEPTLDISTIVLSAHIANTTDVPQFVTIKLEKSGSAGLQTATLVRNAAVPPYETLNPFSGRVVLERGNKFIIETAVSGAFDVSLSVLENANQ